MSKPAFDCRTGSGEEGLAALAGLQTALFCLGEESWGIQTGKGSTVGCGDVSEISDAAEKQKQSRQFARKSEFRQELSFWESVAGLEKSYYWIPKQKRLK